MEEYIFPFQGVSDFNFVIQNEILSFDQFDSLHFSTVNIDSVNRFNEIDEIDEQINNQIDFTINNCEYYDAQRFASLPHCSNFSLLFCNINSFNANFDNYFLSYFSNSSFMPKIFAFCETKCTPG